MASIARPRHSFAPARPVPVHAAVGVLAAVLATATGWPGAAPPRAAEGSLEQASLPELVRTKHRTFSIPFKLPTPKDADAAPQRVMMSVSKDLGGTWEPAGEVAPAAGSFTYRAAADGEYWFQLRAVDRKGRVRGGAGADMRVLVDAAGPRLVARVWKGADGEIVCRYAAVDDSIRVEALKLEYRSAGEQGWKSVAAQGVLARESPAHLVGEEIWWAGEKVEELAVRITVADSSGNQTVKQFSLEPADPQVDQDTLARELGAPALPGSESAVAGPASRPDVPSFPAQPGPAAPAAGPAGGWSAETAAAWSGEQPRSADAVASRGPAAMQSVLAHPVGTAGVLVDPAASAPARPLLTSSSAGLPAPPTSADQPLEYRGRPLQLTRSRRFSWDYELPADRPATGRVRVELWSTRDGGVSWQRTAVDDDAQSPIAVALPAAGLYGFRLEVASDVPEGGAGPRPGDPAESWIGVDEEPPHVELLGVRKAEAEGNAVLVRYTSRDQLPAPQTARLMFSPNADGPWATIATGLANQGEQRWQPDRNTPSRVYLRLEVTDAAGNVGSATTPQPVALATARVVGRLGGLRTLPPAP
jgi:hypothetical protein